MRCRAVVMVVVSGSWLLAALGLELLGHQPLPTGEWDAIVVAGCRVLPDGTPSDSLQRRTDVAVSLWLEGRAPEVIFTGGVGSYPPSEAAAAAAYAMSIGLPEAVIQREDRSTSTEENARLAAAQSDARRVILVSDTYHLFRASKVFGHHFDAVQTAGAVSPIVPRLRGALREVAAVGWYAIRGRL